VAPRTRTLAFGSTVALVLGGGLCAALVGGVTGEVLTIVLMSAGFAGAVLLVFFEVGLSEDRERARDEQRRRGRRRLSLGGRGGPRFRQRPRRPG
jgi:hypothetical protein